MHILSRRIGRLPFVLVSILLYLSVPLYYAAWEYETVSSYVMEPTGLIMGLFAILGSGIPFCFGHQIGVLDSLEFTAPFALLLLLATLWRCNDCRASRLLLIGQWSAIRSRSLSAGLKRIATLPERLLLSAALARKTDRC